MILRWVSSILTRFRQIRYGFTGILEASGKPVFYCPEEDKGKFTAKFTAI
ncbi:MAG TPA: hypothetical protein VN426_02105 [Syntrophomonadaceae bacterium]|nr:hypothetical protein [Syntrophomonadaceae bacterium]